MRNERIKELIAVANQAYIDGKILGFEICQNVFKFEGINDGEFMRYTYPNFRSHIDEIINDINKSEFVLE
ncbi:MAG: hypothetical protein ACRCXK_03710 [Wohlfahrtiimonas sp.]